MLASKQYVRYNHNMKTMLSTIKIWLYIKHDPNFNA